MSELPVSVTTEYTYPLFRKFYNFNSFFRSTGMKVSWIVLAVLWILMIPIAVIQFLSNPVGGSSTLAVVIMITLIFAIYLPLIPRIIYKKQYISKGVTETTVFTAEGIDVVTQSSATSGSQKWAWHGLHSAHETKGFFYIYVAKNQAIITDKSKMSEGDIEAVRALLASVMGPKFHKK